jgi:hypothetical protein
MKLQIGPSMWRAPMRLTSSANLSTAAGLPAQKAIRTSLGMCPGDSVMPKNSVTASPTASNVNQPSTDA